MIPRFTVGTRVRILRALYSDQQGYNGQEGIVVEATPRPSGETSYVVQTGSGFRVRTRNVEMVTEPEVPVREGDRVRIDAVLYTRERTAAVGQVGIVTKITSGYTGRLTTYLVQVGVNEFTATEVHVITPTAQVAPAAETPTPIEVNVKRAQAAQFAHNLLGSEALLDDVITLAAFVAGEDGQVAPAAITGDVHISTTVPQPTPPNPAADRALTESSWRNECGLDVWRDKSNDDDVINVEGYYLKEADVVSLIEYLQAAVRVHTLPF